jgi:hypothetical protein
MEIGTMTVSNIFHSDQLTMSANVFVTEGSTLTLSNIFHTDQLTMTSNIVMGSDKTLTTSNIVANTGENLSLNSNLFVDTATGNVGIGTDITSAPLHIYKSSNYPEVFVDYGAGGQKMSLATGTSGSVLGYSGYLVIGTITDAQLAGLSEKVRIDSSGNVGIGVASPTQKLDVNGSVAVNGNGNIYFNNALRQHINLWGTDYGIGIQGATTYFRTGGNFFFYKGGSHNDNEGNAGGGSCQMSIRTSGYVGIGTDAPRRKLEVYGSAETFEGRTARVQIIDSGRYVDVGHGGYVYIGSREAGHSGGWSYAMFQNGIPGNWTDASGQRRSFNRVILNFRYFNISNGNAGTTWRFVVYLTRNGSSIQKAEWYAGDVGNARGYMTTSSPIINLAWSDVPGLIMYVYDNTYSGWTCRIGSMWLTYVSD